MNIQLHRYIIDNLILNIMSVFGIGLNFLTAMIDSLWGHECSHVRFAQSMWQWQWPWSIYVSVTHGGACWRDNRCH